MTAALGPLRLDDSYARAVPELSLPWRGAPAAAPRLLVADEALADELGIDPDWLRSPEGLAILTGQVPEDVPTYAQGYSGHQFGGYSPRLGDGRALLLGELLDPRGQRRDLHLKGSGRTPFARGGDGRAVVGPMLREHLMSVWMHAVGIPTTRALAVVATGESVLREGPQPGAVLCRVAASHLRVGTVQYAAASGDRELLERLVRYALQRHYPEVGEGGGGDIAAAAVALLDSVIAAQARLIARWMAVGFVHGVMNTDNMTLSGETIDYGPCAMLDAHDPGAVFSSIDTYGRYAYGNQPEIAVWNLARLAEALLPLVDPNLSEEAVERVTQIVLSFRERYDREFVALVAAKLGLPGPDRELVHDFLGLLAAQGVDHTNAFRGVADGSTRALFVDPAPYDAWSARRDAAAGLSADRAAAQSPEAATSLRPAVASAEPDAPSGGEDPITRNPVVIPRNHVVEAALAAANEGDLAPYEQLVAALARPFEVPDDPSLSGLLAPAPEGTAPHVTFCGT